MDSSKHQLSIYSESDDFLQEFYNFVRQHKETDARQAVSRDCNVTPTEIVPTEIIPTDIIPTEIITTEIIPTEIISTEIIPTEIIPTENKSALSIIPTSEETLALDIATTSSDTSYFIEGQSIRSDRAKRSGFPIDASNDAIIGVLSEPVISIIDHTLDPYIVNAKTGGINDTFVPFYNEGQDDITERVSAELEKVLNDPAAFEDIELYLECSEDDIETIQEDTFKRSRFQSGNFSLHAGNSTIQSETHLKISFPSIQDDYIYSGIKRCSSCKLPFSTDSDLLNHLDVSTCEVLICKDCVYNTKSVKRFITHMEKRHDVVHIDRLLHNFTNSYRKLQDAANTHSIADDQDYFDGGTRNTVEIQAKDAITDIMNNGDRTSASCNNDNEISEPETRYHCNVCKYIGKTRKLLKMHQQYHTPTRKQYDCQVCDFKCLQKRTFVGHMRSHEDVYLFHCSECHCQFTTASALNRHSKTHRTERLYKCSVCFKTFKIKGTLTDHMKKVHKISSSTARENNFDSPQQGVDISKRSQSDLIVTRTNSSSKIDNTLNAKNVSTTSIKFCNSAEKKPQEYITSTEDSMELDSQSQDYISRKPTKDEETQTKSDKHFFCTWPGCGKSFRDNYNLNNHYSRHTLSKRISCPECDFKCIQKGNLTYHQKTKHAKRKCVKS